MEMIMKKNIIFIAGAVIGILSLLSSCGKMLEVTPPNSITEEQVQDLMLNGNDATKEKIMTAIAAPMIRYFNYANIQYTTGAAAPMVHLYQGINWARSLQGNDMAIGADQSQDHLAGKAYYDFTVNFTLESDYSNYAHWFGYAYAINQANMLLGYMTPEAAASNNLYKDGRARGLLVRAFSYMSLMEEYQDAYLQGGKDKLGMSLYDTYDPGQEPKARSTAEETYKFIKDDLTEAVSLLTSAGIGYTVGYDNLEDFDLGLANFLLARASLWTGDYATCISACKAIINSGKYSFIAPDNWGGRNTGSWTEKDENNCVQIEMLPENNAFTCLQKNPEVILGYKITSSYANTTIFSLANPFCGYSGSGTMPRIDDRLYNKINDNDCRKDAFRKEKIGDYAYATLVHELPSYVAMKFAATLGLNNAGNGHEDKSRAASQEETKFRVSEVYLMLAEAQNASGDANGAKATLNALLAARTKPGAETLTCDNYGNNGSLTDFIQLQWRIEMWGENGREYFNNKRWGVNVNRNGSQVHRELGKDGITYPYTKMTCQIPDKETQTNKLCEKNNLAQ
jgi:hypothetical protein